MRDDRAEMLPPGRWCKGHGVHGTDGDQDDSLCNGHWVLAEHVKANFSTRDGAARAIKGFSRTLQPRCTKCQSIQNHHDDERKALRYGQRWRREHAARWTKTGRTQSVSEAFIQMDVGGVTAEWLAEQQMAARGQLCPGLCCYEHDGGLIRHTMDHINHIEMDVRDPNLPFSRENVGPLCSPCNGSKGETPWGEWIWRRRAQIEDWWNAIRQRGRGFGPGEQGTLDFG